LETSSPAIVVGDTARVRITGNGQSQPGKINWKSLDQGVATVDATGLVRALSRGNVRITGEAGGATDTVRIHIIPDKLNVDAKNACGPTDNRPVAVMGVSEHAIVVADKSNPAGGFTATEYQALADTFEREVYPLITHYFGEPADIDGNRRVIILYTSAVNELTPPGSDGYVGGFFHPRDLFPKTSTPRMEACAGSNEAEMFYMLAPDPTGTVNGNVRTKEDVRGVTVGTIAHEFQHLINASRRIFLNDANSFESAWLNEGLSHIAEELLFYASSGLGPGQNIDVEQIFSARAEAHFNAYQISNFARLERYLRNTAGQSAYSDSVGLGERGASWHYLRYVADRTNLSERDIWYKLVNSQVSGFANLQQVAGQDPLRLYRDWTIATYADDLVATTDSRFQELSWNQRSILSRIFDNPALLKPGPLTPAVPVLVPLYGGGATYFQFGVAPQQRAEIRVKPAAEGTPAQGACSNETPPVVLGVGEVYAPLAGEGNTVCLEGGSAGEEYVVVITNVGKDVARPRPINVVGYGIAAPAPVATASVASPAPFLAASSVRPSMTVAGGFSGLVRDYSMDLRIRHQEQVELAPRLGSMGALRARASFQALPEETNELYISLIRIR
jgi:hypothetical protein